jgi:hypothetical protein
MIKGIKVFNLVQKLEFNNFNSLFLMFVTVGRLIYLFLELIISIFHFASSMSLFNHLSIEFQLIVFDLSLDFIH